MASSKTNVTELFVRHDQGRHSIKKECKIKKRKSNGKDNLHFTLDLGEIGAYCGGCYNLFRYSNNARGA